MQTQYIYVLKTIFSKGPFVALFYLSKYMLRQVLDACFDFYKNHIKEKFSYRILKVNKEYENKLILGYEVPNDLNDEKIKE